jgi:hypothetical protein
MASKNDDLIKGIQPLMNKFNEEKLTNNHNQQQELSKALHEIKLFFIGVWQIILAIFLIILSIIFYYLPDSFFSNDYFISFHNAYCKMINLFARFVIDGIIISFLKYKFFKKN